MSLLQRPRRSVHRVSTTSRTAGRPAIEPLEPRILLSTINWINRGISDNFDLYYGDQASIARSVVDAAIDQWERTIVDFNWNDGTTAFEMTLFVEPTWDSSIQGQANPTADDGAGVPTAGRVRVSRGNDGFGDGWFFDPTPNDNSEYLGGIDHVFRGFAQAGSPGLNDRDFYSLVMHEMGHMLGMTSWDGYLWGQDTATVTFTDTGVVDTVYNTGGTWWTFNGPSIDHLLTNVDGTGFGSISAHSAGGGAVVNFNGVDYRGVFDLMNPRLGPGNRRLIPDTLALMLADVYGYTISLPQTRGTFHAMVLGDGELRITGGADDSNDEIRVWVDGNLLKVSVDLGNDVPGTGALPGPGNLPAFVSEFVAGTISHITIDAGGGNDFIWIDELPGSKPVNIIAGDGDDTIFIANTTANLDAIHSWVTVNGGSGNNTLGLWDDASAYDGTYNITDASVTRPGSNFEGLSYFNISNLTLHGSQQDNVFNVQTMLAGTGLTIHGWAGNDQLHLAPASRNLNSIAGPVTFNAGHGNDLIVLHDDGQNANRIYTVDGEVVQRAGFGGLEYLGAEQLRLLGGGGGGGGGLTGGGGPRGGGGGGGGMICSGSTGVRPRRRLRFSRAGGMTWWHWGRNWAR